MSPEQALTLARFAHAARPQQKWDEQTVDVWAVILDDIAFDDARAVVIGLAKNARFIDVDAIREGVTALRNQRLETYKDRIPAPPDPDDVAGAITWQRQWNKAVADGQVPPEQKLTPGQMPPLAQLLPAMPAAPSGRRAVSHANPALSRACPWCKAPVGKRCTNGSQSVAWVHDARSGSTPAAEAPSQEQHT